MALVCTSCGSGILPGDGFYADDARRFYCAGCWLRPGDRGSTEIRPESLSHAEQVNQRLIKTAAALTQAEHLLRTSQESLDRAQKAQAEALQRYQHLCRQMAEAATSWAILREKEGQG